MANHRPHLYGENLSTRAYPSYPGRANFSYISLQNVAKHLHEKQEVGSARRKSAKPGQHFSGILARLPRSRRDNKRMGEPRWPVLRKATAFFKYQRPLTR